MNTENRLHHQFLLETADKIESLRIEIVKSLAKADAETRSEFMMLLNEVGRNSTSLQALVDLILMDLEGPEQ